MNIPTDAQISEAQEKLNFKFSDEYISFLKSGYDLNDIALEALEIADPPSYVDIYQALRDARKYYDLPKHLLTICEDNSDYYCLTAEGEVVFWSHNGVTEEKWANVTVWRNEMVKEFSE